MPLGLSVPMLTLQIYFPQLPWRWLAGLTYLQTFQKSSDLQLHPALPAWPFEDLQVSSPRRLRLLTYPCNHARNSRLPIFATCHQALPDSLQQPSLRHGQWNLLGFRLLFASWTAGNVWLWLVTPWSHTSDSEVLSMHNSPLALPSDDSACRWWPFPANIPAMDCVFPVPSNDLILPACGIEKWIRATQLLYRQMREVSEMAASVYCKRVCPLIL